MNELNLTSLKSKDDTLKAIGLTLLKSLNGGCISIVVKKNNSEITYLNPKDILDSISMEDLIRALLSAQWSDPDIEEFLNGISEFFYDGKHPSS